MAKAKKKSTIKWTDSKEIELENCYRTLDMDMKALKERFNCTAEEIKQKLKELGSWGGA